MNLAPGKKIFFASDFHLGVPNYEDSLVREKRLVKWLDEIKSEAAEIFLMGDLFDFWFEYKTVIPKGFVRIQGKLAELCDAGIPVHLFTGNHDMWLFDYLPKELGVQIHRNPIAIECNGKHLYLGHGDGLGPGDYGYKSIKAIFSNKFCQWLFARIHPNFGIGVAQFWSRRSRIATGNTDDKYHGEEKERLVVFSKEKLKEQHYDFFVFGHRHLPLDIKLPNNSRYINLGDWIKYYSYAVFDGEKLTLEKLAS